MLALLELEEGLAHHRGLLGTVAGVESQTFIVLARQGELCHLVQRRVQVLPLVLGRLHQGIRLLIIDGDILIAGDAVLDHLHAGLILAFEFLQALRIVTAGRHDDRHALRVAHAAQCRADIIQTLYTGLVHRVDIILGVAQPQVPGHADCQHTGDRDDAQQQQLAAYLHVVKPFHLQDSFHKIPLHKY